jgi:hypothetical protein
VILCVVTVILLVVQNVVGLLVASIAGAHPFYGLLIGSISFVGGPGTAAAWAKEAQAMGLAHAPEVAVGAATLAVVVGAIVSGPITGWLIKRRNLNGPTGQTPASWVAPEPVTPAPAPPIATIMQVLLLIVVAVLAGAAANDWGRNAGLVLPGFLTAMLAGVAITNLGDAIGAKFDFVPIERGGEIALQAFLVMYLMSLKLWTLGAAIGPLMANVVIQVVVTATIGVVLLFRWLGRDYDAAVTVGGFLGFGLSSMPVAMAYDGQRCVALRAVAEGISAHYLGRIVLRRPGKRLHSEGLSRAPLVSLTKRLSLQGAARCSRLVIAHALRHSAVRQLAPQRQYRPADGPHRERARHRSRRSRDEAHVRLRLRAPQQERRLRGADEARIGVRSVHLRYTGLLVLGESAYEGVSRSNLGLSRPARSPG